MRVVTLGAVTAGITLTAATAAGADPMSGFPAPPKGAIVYAREFGQDVLALGVVPKSGGVSLQASIVGSQGQSVKGAHVTFSVSGGKPKAARASAAGRYTTTFALQKRPVAITTTVNSKSWTVKMPTAWPPKAGSALMARARKAYDALRSLTDLDYFATGPGEAVTTTWEFQAPNREAYQVQGGDDSVIIAGKRWERTSGSKPWSESPQAPLRQPAPFWVSVTDAHVLGTVKIHGRPAWDVSFYDPATPGWFDVKIDPATYHVLDMRMETTDHFMHDVYSKFNSTAPVVAPH